MAASSDSDDDDTFVTLGTPLDIPEEDEPRRKPVSLQDMQAKDSQGRARFHGAFTGGYSAGYFNTVGSQKGWTPSTFVSSRGSRAETGGQQKPEDFMDEEDLGEYGIAPRKLVTAGTFSSEERKRRRQDELKMASVDAIIPGQAALLDLIVPERITIGVKLLRKMGWKEGQGIGPRLNKKQKKRQKAGVKVYGCEMPPSPGSGDDDIDDESFLSSLTFAPRDTTQIHLSVKSNTHGLGYRGLDPRRALPSTHVNLFGPPPISKSGRKGIRGQAFGVGALEEEDEDIYSVDDMSRYDMTMGDEDQAGSLGWTGPRQHGPAKTPVGYVGELLEGFKLSATKLVQKKLFPPPDLPRGFRPVHIFSQPDQPVSQPGTDYRQFLAPGSLPTPTSSTPQVPAPDKPKSFSDATSRSLALGEQAFVGSVFDLMSKEDKEKLASKSFSTKPSEEKGKVQTLAESSDKGSSTGQAMGSKSVASKPEGLSSVEVQRRENVPLFQGTADFKPFSKNPHKQERYDRYLASIRQGHKDPYSDVKGVGLTEWEADREKEEFAKAASLYKPLAAMMAQRFTTGSQLDDATAEPVRQKQETAKSDAVKAAEMKMYGKLTREVHEWHPDRIVCKRFNVPDPYPGSNIIGLASVKRDKYSVFNFLDFANTPPTEIPALEASDSQTSEKIGEGTTEPEGKVEKALNKSNAMKSIFSHLVEPQTEARKSAVSFSVKRSKPQKQAYKSIFSHLEGEESQESRKPVSRETDTVIATGPAVSTKEGTDKQTDPGNSSRGKPEGDKEGKSEKEAGGMDLFRAIFRNTDSEDSGSSSSSDGEDGARMDTGVTGAGDIPVSDGQSSVVRNSQTSVVSEDKDNNKSGMSGVRDTEVSENMAASHSLSTPQQQRSEHSLQESQTASAPEEMVLPGSGEKLPSLASRLSPGLDSEEDEEESYGPALPPSTTQGSSSSPALGTEPPGSDRDVTKQSSRKHRHKDKHKSKKSKKEKHKKNKHKKKHKKKESSKRKRRHRESSDSSGDSSGESDSDPGDLPSDRDLLHRMKLLKPGRRAADL